MFKVAPSPGDAKASQENKVSSAKKRHQNLQMHVLVNPSIISPSATSFSYWQGKAALRRTFFARRGTTGEQKRVFELCQFLISVESLDKIHVSIDFPVSAGMKCELTRKKYRDM